MTLCNMTQDDLVTCKPAVTKSNPPVDPSMACCTALSKADFTCLCSYKNSMVLPSFGIDPDLAMQLPVKCKLSSSTKC
ncbi:Bifunctional inhibitor/plant lipid transfer protein/seed storage helical domain [Macleaya cordata]|uniref:Bifunctional inhibitor/plant lipid transfer protein/seed storage helical domain n=1 Tax=Macleaya cordata TaxID=56857 RepID=A0A200QE55_MACCD|nr:Bifunctional inhibitor/plant lipid transfer protein/seed storage helical domain [Macleaya cordata]